MKTRRKSDCCASIKSEKLNNFVEQVSDHTDPSSATKCETMKVKANFKRRACDSLDNPRKIKYRSTECIRGCCSQSTMTGSFGKNNHSKRTDTVILIQ